MKMISYVITTLIFIFLLTFVSASSIHSNQINFNSDENTTHYQTITLDNQGEIKVEVDNNFNVTWTNPSVNLTGGELIWYNESNVEFNLTSPENCDNGDIYKMNVYENNVSIGQFTFVCIPDDEIVDYKAEYGHGDGNYLDYESYPYLPAHDIALFNLIRVYTYGSYLDPDEDGLNATITCQFPDYLVKVRQKNEGTEIIHSNDGINATFYWTSLFGNWFRLAPLEQELTNLNVGDTYNISCDELVYHYTTGEIRADIDDISFEIRSTSPLSVSTSTDITDKSIVYFINNTEKYPIYDIELMWKTNSSETKTTTIQEILPGEAVSYEIFLDGHGSILLDASFVPVWQETSLKPQRYEQTFSDSFNFNDNDAAINEIASKPLNTIQTEIVDVDKIVATETYTATITLYDIFGNYIVPDSLPSITIIDPNGNTLINSSSMTLKYNGVYTYEYVTYAGSSVGEYLSEVTVIYNGETIYLNDVWRLISNPTEVNVEINSVCGNTVCGNIFITNEGTTPFEYIYYWWTTDNPLSDYDAGDVTDRGQASKLVMPGDTWSIKRCIYYDKDSGNLHYFRAKTFYGEYSYATTSFDENFGCRGKREFPSGYIIIPPISPQQAATYGSAAVALAGIFFLLFKRKREEIFV